MYILRPDIAEDEVTNHIDKYNKLLEEFGATILDSQMRGKRRLAYQIAKHREGIYVQLSHQGDGQHIFKIEKAMRLGHLRTPTDAQKSYLEENVIQRFKSWTAQHQLLWIAACLRNSFSKDVSKLFNQLRKVIPNPSLEISDLVGIISLVNTSVANSNNMSALIQRYQCLSEVYSVLTSRLENLIPDSRKTNLAKTRSSGKRIAIFCSPLIHINHAPSNRVLEISATLKKRYGYKVKIFAGGTFHYNVNSAGAIFSTNAMKIPKEDETLDFNGEAIPIWTSYMDDSQYKKHLETLNNILNFMTKVISDKIFK